MSAVLTEFLEKIAVHFSLPGTTRRLLGELLGPDVDAAAMAHVIRANQYVEHALLREVAALGLKDNTPGLQAAIGLFGMSRTRDFVCALQLERCIGGRHPTAAKSGRLELKPAVVLKCALRAESVKAQRGVQGTDLAFAAGFLFDVMRAVARDRFGNPPGFEDFAAEVFQHSLRSALLGDELVGGMGLPRYARYVFAACLAHDLGKLALALLRPKTAAEPAAPGDSYVAFRASAARIPVSRFVGHFAETRRYGVGHETLSACLAARSGVLLPIEKALLFHHQPYLLAGGPDRALWSLAGVIALATNMANAFRVPEDVSDTVIGQWLPPELAGFSYSPQSLIAAMEKVSKSI